MTEQPKDSTDSDPQSLKILVLKDRYQTRFMTPFNSRHDIRPKHFIPFDTLSGKLPGVTVMSPDIGADLVHAHNRIPIGASKLIISFESHMPRAFDRTTEDPIVRRLRRRTADPSCRRLVAMSKFAAREFEAQNKGTEEYETLKNKLVVRYPNLEIDTAPDQIDLSEDGPLKLCFVGAHFGRKGGCVAVRLAEKALAENVPLEITIISSLQAGGAIWTDPTREDFFEPYFKLLDLPNVRNLGAQPNAVVRQTFAQSHFSLLPTFADTFGYSVIEAMANYTPAITTDICALPEMVQNDFNGFMVNLPKDPVGGWAGMDYDARDTAQYEQVFSAAIDDLAEQILEGLKPYLEDRTRMAPLRANARKTAEAMFDAKTRTQDWDEFYDRIHAEPATSEAIASPADNFAPNVADLVA